MSPKISDIADAKLEAAARTDLLCRVRRALHLHPKDPQRALMGALVRPEFYAIRSLRRGEMLIRGEQFQQGLQIVALCFDLLNVGAPSCRSIKSATEEGFDQFELGG